MRLILWAICTLAFSCSAASALQILSQRDSTRQINGILTLNTQISVLCQGSSFDWGVDYSFQITSDDGQVQSLTITCSQPIRRYLISYYGVVPDTSVLVESTICSARAPGEIQAAVEQMNATQAEHEGIRPNTGFSLLELAGNAYNLDDALTVTAPNSTESQTYPADATVAAACVAVMATQGFAAYNSYASCAQGPTREEFNQVESDVNNTLTSFTNWQTSFRNRNGAVNGTLTKLFDLFIDTGKWIDTTRQRILNANETRILLQQAIKQQARTLTSEINEVADKIGVATALTGEVATQLADLINVTSSEFDRLVSSIVRAKAITMQNLHLEMLSIARDRSDAIRQINSIQQAILDQSTNIQKYYLGEADIRAHNRVLQGRFTALALGVRDGKPLYPFTERPGTEPIRDPLNLNPGLASIVIGNDVFRYISTSEGTTYGYVSRLQFVCDTVTMLTSAPLNPDWRQFYESVGPPGCDATWSDSSNRCKCAILLTEERCRMSLAPSSDEISQWRSPIDRLDTFNNTACIAPAVLSNKQTVTSVLDLASVFANITSRGVLASTTYQQFSFRPRFYANVPYDQALGSPDAFLNGIYEQNGLTNLATMYLNTLPVSYQVVYNHMDSYAEAVFGVPPDHLTHSKQAFRNVSGQIFTRCSTVHAAMYSHSFLTVGILTESDLATDVRVTAGDGEEQLISNPAYAAGAVALLPEDGSGILYDPARFDQVVYDAPVHNLVISAFNRDGQITQPVVPEPALFLRDYYELVNGEKFDHSMAGHSPSAYLTTLDNNPSSLTYRRCTGRPLASGGYMCALREAYDVFATGAISGTSGGGFLVMGDRMGSYTFTATVPSGVISSNTDSACPVVQALASSGLNTVLRLYNQLATENRLRVTETGPCGTYSDDNLRLPPSRAVTYLTRFCPANTEQSATVVRFAYQPNPATPTVFVNCSDSVNVTLGSTGSAVFAGAATLNFTIQINSIASTSILDIMTNFKLWMLNITAQLVMSDASSYSDSFDFSLAAETATNVTAIIDRLNGISLRAANATADAITYSRQLSRQDYPYTRELDAAAEEDDRLRRIQEEQLAAIEADQSELNLQLADLKETTRLENNNIRAYAGASIALSRSATVAISKQLESDAPNWEVAAPDNKRCSPFERCGYASVGSFLKGLGEEAGEALGDAVNGVLELAASGVNGVLDFLFNGPLAGLLGWVVMIAVLIGLVCCVVQCMPFIGQACKTGASVCCPKTDGSIQHVTGQSPSALHLLKRLSQLKSATKFTVSV